MPTAQETLALVKKALSSAISPDVLAKTAGYTQSASAISGLTQYDLEGPAKTLYPVLTPFRNELPRDVGGAGIQANWRAVTGVNTTFVDPGVSEGHRGGAITFSSSDYLAIFKGFGLEGSATFEADYAADGYDDVKARAVTGTLRATMIAEEWMIVGGNTSAIALGTTPTPTLAQVADTTSTVTNSTLSVICVALSYRAYWALAGLNNGATGSSLGVTVDPNGLTGTRTNAGPYVSTDVINGGTAIKSAAATVTIDAAHKSCTASVTPVAGAFGYAWYWNTAGNECLGAVSTLNSIAITANPGSAIAVGANLAADKSQNALHFDGLLYQALKSGSGAYVSAQATGVAGTGTKLTSDGAGGITEINNMNADRWNLYRLSMNELWVSGQEAININNIIIKNGGAPLIRFGMDGGGTLEAGVMIGSLLNKITGEKMRVKTHPNLPPGAMFARCTSLPYALSGVPAPIRMRLRRDYHQIEWPVLQRQYEYGVYFDGVLQNYFPPATGVIYNIPNAS